MLHSKMILWTVTPHSPFIQVETQAPRWPGVPKGFRSELRHPQYRVFIVAWCSYMIGLVSDSSITIKTCFTPSRSLKLLLEYISWLLKDQISLLSHLRRTLLRHQELQNPSLHHSKKSRRKTTSTEGTYQTLECLEIRHTSLTSPYKLAKETLSFHV